jgi:hypothetical protein
VPVMEDVSRELTDIVPSAEELLFDITSIGPMSSLGEVKLCIERRVKPEFVDAVVDVLIWSGCLGVQGPKGPTYISDSGFRRPFIRSQVSAPSKKECFASSYPVSTH